MLPGVSTADQYFLPRRHKDTKIHKERINFMKLRIRGNSLRIRLSKKEVAKIAEDGYLEEQTSFGENKFIYALEKVDKGNELTASLDLNKITVFVPSVLVNNWPENDITGFNANMPLSGKDSLFLLLEKDFICLDETTEDQSDNYENPHKTC